MRALLASLTLLAGLCATAQVPEGEARRYEFSGSMFVLLYGSPVNMTDAGIATDIVYGDEGKVWIKNAINRMPTGHYMEGELSADGRTITVTLPQEYGDGYTLDRLYYNDDYMTFFPDPDVRTMTYSVGADGVITMDYNDECLLGLTVDNVWEGYGEFKSRFVPFNDEVIVPLSNGNPEPWVVVSEESGWEANVVAEEGEIWVQGLFRDFPNAWIYGQRNGDAYAFADKQFLGVWNDAGVQRNLYARTGEIERVYNDVYDDWLDVRIYALDATTMTVNDDLTMLQAATGQGFYLNSGAGGLMVVSSILEPTMRKGGTIEVGTPRTPVFVQQTPFDSEGRASLTFDLFPFDDRGNWLDPERIHWNLYFDGVPVTFTPDRYVLLSEPMTDVPYSYTDAPYDFWVHTEHRRSVFYYDRTVQHLGVTMTYTDDEGNTYTSEMLTMASAGIADVEADATVATEYYTVAGSRAAADTPGMLIRLERLSNGNTRINKIINQ